MVFLFASYFLSAVVCPPGYHKWKNACSGTGTKDHAGSKKQKVRFTNMFRNKHYLSTNMWDNWKPLDLGKDGSYQSGGLGDVPKLRRRGDGEFSAACSDTSRRSVVASGKRKKDNDSKEEEEEEPEVPAKKVKGVKRVSSV